MRTFFTVEGCDSEFAKLTLPTLKAFVEGRSQNVPGNKQSLVARAIGCTKPLFFSLSLSLFLSHELAIFWSAGEKKTPKKEDTKTLFSTLHPLSLVIFATATVVAFVLLRNSRFSFHCYTQRVATPTQKSARK